MTRYETCVSHPLFPVYTERACRCEFDAAKFRFSSPDPPPGRVRIRPCGVPRRVRFLAPFDPAVWDRRRVEQLWGWPYRFEAYTPLAKRKLGYYALPLLWRDRVVGWGNVSAAGGRLVSDLGYVSAQPRDRGFRGALEAELARLAAFLEPR